MLVIAYETVIVTAGKLDKLQVFRRSTQKTIHDQNIAYIMLFLLK